MEVVFEEAVTLFGPTGLLEMPGVTTTTQHALFSLTCALLNMQLSAAAQAHISTRPANSQTAVSAKHAPFNGEEEGLEKKGRWGDYRGVSEWREGGREVS